MPSPLCALPTRRAPSLLDIPAALRRSPSTNLCLLRATGRGEPTYLPTPAASTSGRARGAAESTRCRWLPGVLAAVVVLSASSSAPGLLRASMPPLTDDATFENVPQMLSANTLIMLLLRGCCAQVELGKRVRRGYRSPSQERRKGAPASAWAPASREALAPLARVPSMSAGYNPGGYIWKMEVVCYAMKGWIPTTIFSSNVPSHNLSLLLFAPTLSSQNTTDLISTLVPSYPMIKGQLLSFVRLPFSFGTGVYIAKGS